MLAIFGQRRRADHMEFTARQGGFEHIASVHAAFGFAGANHGVNFINEQNNFASRFFHFFQNCFEALFELTAKTSTRQ